MHESPSTPPSGATSGAGPGSGPGAEVSGSGRGAAPGAAAPGIVIPGVNPGPAAADRRRYRIRSRWIYLLVGAFMALAVLYGVDLVTSIGRVPRGTEVAGVNVGGMRTLDAEEKLSREVGPRVGDPVPLRAGVVSTSLDPKAVGLSVDWQGTLDRAGEQPLNPITRLVSLFRTHEVGIASIIPDQRLTAFLEKLALQADFGPSEGAIWFDREQVRSKMPLDGQKLQIENSRDAVLGHWLDEDGVDLAVTFTPTETKIDQVRALVRDVAEPAASLDTVLLASKARSDGSEPPVTTVTTTPPAPEGESAPAPRTQVMVSPSDPDAVRLPFPRDRIGEYLSFVKNGANLEARFDADAAKGLLEPLMASTEQQGKDATFSFSGDTATVVPAVKGRTVEWGPLLGALPATLTQRSGERMVPVTYTARDPELSTEEAQKAGIRTKVGEFTIAVGASGRAGQMLSELNGRFIPGGGSFSLNAVAGSASGDIGADAVATALFNAAYEAGAQSLGRTARGTAASAFPSARDASAARDVSFRNGQSSGLVVEAAGDARAVTVRLWGTREFQVSTSTSPRSDVRAPATRQLSGPDCTPSDGQDGYTVRAERTVRRGAETVSTDTFTSTYAPVDKVECRPEAGGPAGSPAPGAPAPPPGIAIPGLPPIQIPGLPAPR